MSAEDRRGVSPCFAVTAVQMQELKILLLQTVISHLTGFACKLSFPILSKMNRFCRK